ncbi:MAG: hypothetical protein LIP77_06105 [Planctomycetes bacterium]|nr:hypothetical protein [Planctomycetota bacterium]
MDNDSETRPPDEGALRRADLAFGVVLAAMAIVMLIGAVRIFFNPFGRDFHQVRAQEVKSAIVNWHQSAALLPGLLSLVLLILSLVLIHVALMRGAKADFLRLGTLVHLVRSGEGRVFAAIVLQLCLYAYFLLPFCRQYLDVFPRFQGFPFLVATFLYLAVMMMAFNARTKGAMVLSLTLAAVAAGAITYGFGMLALIPLP